MAIPQFPFTSTAALAVVLCILWLPSMAEALNRNPSFTPGSSVSVAMNSARVNLAWATNIDDGDGGTQTVLFTVTPVNSALFDSNGVTMTNAGILSFTPVTDKIGSTTVNVILIDDGQMTCSNCTCSPADCRRSITQQFTITITAVNQCPSWTMALSTIDIVEGAGTQTKTNFATAMSPGTPSHESTQKLRFDVTTAETILFAVVPTMDYTTPATTANLRFEAASGANGIATVYVTLIDDGGTSNGGCDRAATRSFTIRIAKVNTPPSFIFGPTPVTVLENSGLYRRQAWAQQISAGENEPEQTVSFNVQLVDGSQANLFKLLPQIDTNGQLSFEAQDNKNTFSRVIEAYVQLQDNFNNYSCNPITTCRKVRVVITPVNQKPSFTAGSDVEVWEDRKDSGPVTFSWAKDMTPGNADEITEGQTTRFVVSSTNGALFSSPPTVSVLGVLSFTLNPYQNGASTVTVTIYDTETENQVGNTAQFYLTVLPSNNAPTFVFAPTQPYQIPMNSSSVTIASFIRSLSAGPTGAADETSQKVWLSVTGTPTNFFTQEPTITTTSSSTASVAFTLAPNKYGTISLSVTAFDDGGTIRGGVNQATQTFTITVTQINAAPEFTITLPQITNIENQYPSGITVPNFITQITSGPYEITSGVGVQTVTFAAFGTNSQLYAKAPNITNTGTLAYTIAADAFGTSTITITATDSGTPPMSTTKTMLLEILPVNHAPRFTPGVPLNDGTLTECRSNPSCSYTFASWATNVSYGPTNEIAQTAKFVVDTGSSAFLFATPPTIQPNTGTLTFSLMPRVNTVATGPLAFSVTMIDSGGVSNGGTDRFQLDVSIAVAEFNDAPTASLGNSLSLRRNGGRVVVSQFLTSITTGVAGMSALDLVYTVVPQNPASFASLPVVSAPSATTASIEATPAAHVYGKEPAVVVIRNPRSNKTTQLEFAITIMFVNEKPSFSLVNATVSIPQGTTSIAVVVLTNITVGRNESALQQYSFSLNCAAVDNKQLFTSDPYIDANGLLRATASASAYGQALCTAVMRDSGGVTNGGADTSDPAQFTVEIFRVNHAPTFTARTSRVDVLQNSGAYYLSRWASDITAGAGDEDLRQIVRFNVACCPTTVATRFGALPSVDSSGALTFTPLPNVIGECGCSITAVDSGSGDAPHRNSSTAVSLVINVIAVNQPPTFNLTNKSISVVARTTQFRFTNVVVGLSPGPSTDSSQQVTLSTTVQSGAALFTSPPTVDATGALMFTTALTASGASSVSVCAADSGGTDNGGIDRSCTTLSISVVKASLTPTFGLANVSVDQLQRAGPVLIPQFLQNVNAPSGFATWSLQFWGPTATACVAGFSLQPAVNLASGDLTFTARDSFVGACLLNLTIGDVGQGTSATQTIELRILAVNLPPTFTTKLNPVTVPYQAGRVSVPWASEISAGDAAESVSQVLTGRATVRTTGILRGNEVVFNGTTGTLSFEMISNEPATVIVEVWLTDNAGTLNGGNDTSRHSIVYLEIVPMNTAPFFGTPASLRLLQSATVRTVDRFALAISPGSQAWEVNQTVTFTVKVNNTAAFLQQPMVSSGGVLQFQTAASFYGIVALVVSAQDNGGSMYGGAATSLNSTCLLEIAFVNTAPTFTLNRPLVYAIQGVTTVEALFVRDLSAGLPAESAQQLTISVDVDQSKFQQPASAAFDELSISAANLTVRPTRFFTGAIPIIVTVRDNGGVADGGANTQTAAATIQILPRNAPPTAVVMPAVVVSATQAGTISVSGFVLEASATEQGQNITVTVTAANTALFEQQPSVVNGALVFSLVPNNASRTTALTVRIRDDGGTANGGNDTTTYSSLLTVTKRVTPPRVTLDISSITVATAATATVQLVRSVISNADSSAVTYDVERTGAAQLPIVPTLTSAGALTCVTGSTAGTATVWLTATNADGGVSTPVAFNITVVAPPRVKLILKGDVSQFNAGTFRATVAQAFGVSQAQVVIASISAGSVVVSFFITGLQPTVTPVSFAQRAANADDPLHTALGVEQSSVRSAGGELLYGSDTTTAPSPTGLFGSSNGSGGDSGMWLGLSTMTWVGILVAAVVVILVLCICGCVMYHRRGVGMAKETVREAVSDKSKKQAASKSLEGKPAPDDALDDDAISIVIDSDDDLPKKPPQLPPPAAADTLPVRRATAPALRRAVSRGPPTFDDDFVDVPVPPHRASYGFGWAVGGTAAPPAAGGPSWLRPSSNLYDTTSTRRW
jgi:hypothetical protein